MKPLKMVRSAAEIEKSPGELHASLIIEFIFWLLNLGSNQGPTD